MSSFRERLSAALVTRGLMTKAQLDQLASEAEASGGRNFIRVLLDRKLLTEAALVGVLAEELSIPTLSLTRYRLDPGVARLVPERVARQYHVIPVAKFGERLLVAMSDPLDIVALDDLKALTHATIDPVLAQETEIDRAIAAAYGPGSLALAQDPAAPAGSGSAIVESAMQSLLDEDTGDVPVVRAINLVITEALRKRASDIHLEPMEHVLRVRYRIDGRLQEAHRIPKKAQSALLSRLKIMSGLDITEWRLPQDGRFKVKLDTREVDFRVSILPITHGGKVVLRVLDRGSLSLGLDHLGFLPDSIDTFKLAVKRPHGMILVTGPTGSGKSTTLYCVLNQLNVPTKNIVTIEDPVEYQLEGVTQIPVNAEIGLTFASGLRAILRQTPDVVMLGEIRDFETADIAMKASLTGHLVLSTLHTNDAPSAVTRLVDMGVEPFLVASSVTLIEAQRLVRKLCAECRKPYEPSEDVLKRLGLSRDPTATFFQAGRCHACQQTGYRGRLGIIEVFLVDERVRELVIAKAPSWEIKRYAIEHLGMTPLRQDGLKKAALGLTTVEEVLQVTADE